MFFTSILDEKVINAIGWTLIQSLWQGMLIAAILIIALRILRKSGSAFRYTLSVVSLLLIFSLSVFNYLHYISDKEIPTVYEKDLSRQKVDLTYFDSSDVNDDDKDDVFEETAYTLKKVQKQSYPYIVTAWLVGVIVFIIRWMLGYFTMYRLTKINSSTISTYLSDRFTLIEKQLGIKKKIRYIESGIAKVPFTIGYLKPLIVVPVGLLTSIPASQLDAVIAHELAHIHRNDYLVNLIVTVVETLFFYNPAVWIISGIVKKERENCCDDMALSVCEKPSTYAKALLSVQEFSTEQYFPAVALSVKKKHLLNRINRTIMKKTEKPGLADKLLAVFIILSGLLALSFTTKENKVEVLNNAKTYTQSVSEQIFPRLSIPAFYDYDRKSENQPESKTFHQKDTTKKEKKDIFIHDHDDNIKVENNIVTREYKDKHGKEQTIQFTLKNGEAENLFVNDEPISDKDYEKHEDIIRETIERLIEARKDIKMAIQEIEEIDIEKIQYEMQEALSQANKELQKAHMEVIEAYKNQDWEKHMEEVEKAMEELDLDEIMKDAREALNDIDFDIEREIMMSMEKIDVEELRKEIERIHQEIDMDQLRKEMEESMKSIDRDEIMREMEKARQEVELARQEMIAKMQNEEGRSIDVDKDKTIRELEHELEKLEKLELEKK